MSSVNARTRNHVRRTPQKSQIPSVHWLFRSNIPRRRASYIAPDIHKRNFFGMGDIIGVLTNPAETVKSLTESKRLLEEARREINETRERAQLRPKHTFSRLPGFFPRNAEMLAIERALEGDPSFTVLFGSSSVGKTALLREVLTRDDYHVLHFDLRIAGFADLPSLYLSLSQQMEQYFVDIAERMEGYEEFEKEAWSFKHDRLNVERRIDDSSADRKHQGVKTSDIARLMELFQSSLLKYWEFQPHSDEHSDTSSSSSKHARRHDTDNTDTSGGTRVEHGSEKSGTRTRWGFKMWGKKKQHDPRSSQHFTAENLAAQEKGKEPQKPVKKKMPVLFFDEAHKLPALIQSTEAMKCLLDSMLVLTKQDRLCHVIHATSDPFFQTWLRQLNVMQHCKIITIGDCSKAETRSFYRDRLLPRVPERFRHGLDFESIYEAFGGKLAHWQDYITDYINSNGALEIKQSSHFLQAHALLNLHIIHSSQAPGQGQEGESPPGAANASTVDTLHPGLGPAGFKIYSAIPAPTSSASSAILSGSGPSSEPPEFTAMQLLKVMSRLSRPDTQYLPYFHLCRELGVRTVDGMVKGRVLDLRWTETVTKESVEEPRVRSNGHMPVPAMGTQPNQAPLAMPVPMHGTEATLVGEGSVRGATPHFDPPPPLDDDDEMIPVSDAEMGMPMGGMPGQRVSGDVFEEVMEVVGPKLVPVTPIMRYAMRNVVPEYEDDQSVSEYASLSDVDEY
ncbi:hypothetical protein CVT24_000257 [Panaeolus cyanescens]|uniref:AAA+ ATPase domain-containing protein n=1 Tax=Panaeolus cyanescens TaxID=181874 RepID=A0A409YD61_9AGAR|nr:hypothetical protein CVT24_000257 [Panaeolus cyanescens]